MWLWLGFVGCLGLGARVFLLFRWVLVLWVLIWVCGLWLLLWVLMASFGGGIFCGLAIFGLCLGVLCVCLDFGLGCGPSMVLWVLVLLGVLMDRVVVWFAY